MGEREVEGDQLVIVDHGTMVMAHALSVFVVQMKVAGAAAAVVVMLAGRQATDIVAAALGQGWHGPHHTHPCFAVGRAPASAQSWATGRDLGSRCIRNHRGYSFDL